MPPTGEPMTFENGALDAALRLVESELPPELTAEQQARLAVAIYQAWLLVDALSRLSPASFSSNADTSPWPGQRS